MGQFFSTIGTNYAKKIPSPNKNIKDYLKVIPRNNKSIFLTPTNHEEIRKLITEFPNKKSSGYDNINNILLKSLKDVISEKLTALFNVSMAQGVFL